MFSRQSSRPYTVGSFQAKLALFEQFIQEFTYVDEELNPEERQQILQARLTNGYEPFCEAIRGLFGNDVSTQDLKALFRKIALNPDAQVDWSELFGIGGSTDEVPDLLLNEDTSSVITTSKRRSVGEAGGDKKRRDVVKSIVQVPKYDFYIIASQKGIICQWSSRFRLQSCVDLNESSWVTGCGFLPSLRRIAVTSERAVSLWDYRVKRKQLTIYQVKPMENSPQCMTYIPWKTDSINEDTILFGDDQGYINLMILTSKDLHMKNSTGKTDSQFVAIEPNKLSYAIQRRKLHDDCVIKIKYFSQLEMFGSCSSSSSCSFILGNIERVFDNSPVRELGVPKGVNCFDYCTKANVIITAGADKVIRVWHPLIFTRPTGKLLGHLFTIVDVAVNEKDQQLISLSTARVFRVWDIQTLSCLQVFTDNEIRPGEKRISCMLFDSKHDRLITGCSMIDTWPLTRAIQDSLQVPHTHDRPICQLLYNPQMNQVISGDAEGMLKVWEMETGQFVYQVTNAHGSSTEITAMTVDSSGYRLATGAYNGSIKVWDFGSGQLYKMYPEEQAKVKHEDTITGLAFCTIQNKRCLLVSAWGRKIRIMEDPADVAILVEFKDLSDLFIPTAPSRINKDEELPFISRTSLPTIGESQEITASNEESVLSECEVTSIELVSPLLFAGTTSGAIVMWNLETQKIVLRLEPPKPRSANNRRRHRDEQLVYKCLYLVHRVRKPIIYGKGNKVKFEASSPETSNHEQYQESKGSEENNEKDGEVSNDEEERIVQRSEEEENRDVEIKGKDELMASEAGEDEEIEDKADNLDKNGKEEITDVDKDAILGAFLQVSEPGLVSAHHDGFLRFWDLSGTLLAEVRAVTRRQASAVTCMCTDADCNFVISGDARGYITVWEVGNFLLHRPTVNSSGEHQGDENVHSKELETKKEPKNVIKQVVCWRGHLTRVVGVEHVQSSEVIVSASTDCSVRVWYRNTGHFIGFFSQPRLWHLPSAKSVPSTPVRPYDISEGPIKTLKSVANTKAVHKITEAGVDCPLMFDDASTKRDKSQG
ncbi:WD repeat-containing protein 64 isoform X2 [Acropora millepora]|uniref:WD repeat-containing protein 64 isoform X2 n=1 Tax=Acropora millepora TaxID=45264 RepID=UPI001CF22EEE|nr:WD repeat-containing protein 64 isoform X2 [Acropora millepora]